MNTLRLSVLALAIMSVFTFATAETVISFDAAANNTRPSAINAAGQVVGWGYDAAWVVHGFLRNPDGTIITLVPPGSLYNYAVGITPAGHIIGYYSDVNGMYHGYLRKPNGCFISFDAGPRDTYPTAINSVGQIAGSYSTSHRVLGFLRNINGRIFTIDLGSGTYPTAINRAGQITGQYIDSTGFHGFLRNADGTIVTFDAGASSTYPVAINSEGRIAGYYSGSDASWHPFLREPSGSITTFDAPDARSTSALGINSDGIIVGSFVDTNWVTHGFIRYRDTSIVLFDAGPSGNYIYDMNADDWMTGQYTDADGQHGFLARQ